ncbi:MAG: glycosyltransferase [Anaerolineae bacterium]
MKLSVIIPVYNGHNLIGRCLTALAVSQRQPDEVIVVDDGSTDGSADVALQHGARLLSRIGQPRGPAYARNRGAEQANGDVLVFLDADVVAHPDVLGLIERHMTDDAQVGALFGSYDNAPPAPGLITRYKNLLHHHVHQTGCRQASTFWAGCGAIRRELFLAMGGFREEYGRPSIEDIELGVRLRQAGHSVRLCPEVQVTHLKRWTWTSLLRTDIRDRAVPWTHLILRQGSIPTALNLDLSARASAALLWMALGAGILGLRWPMLWVIALAFTGVAAYLHQSLYRLFVQAEGRRFAVGALALHGLSLLYSSATFALVAVPTVLARHGFMLLLLVTLVRGLVWSIVVPPFHAPDERNHVQYAQRIARFGSSEVTAETYMPEEIILYGSLTQLDQVRAGAVIDLTDEAGIQAVLAQLDEESPKRTYEAPDPTYVTRAQQFSAQHPPLYYTVSAVVQRALEPWSIRVRWLANRWLSVVMGLVAVACAYGVGRAVWPRGDGRALLLAGLVAFHPMFSFITSVVNNQALEIALFTAFLWVGLHVLRRGLSTVPTLFLGGVLAAGLLTKVSFVAVFPFGLVVVLVALSASLRGGRSWRSVLRYGFYGLAPCLVAVLWYLSQRSQLGGSLLGVYGTPGPARVGLLEHVVGYNWAGVYQDVLHMYWGVFGWLDTPMPFPLHLILTWLTVAAVWSAGGWVARGLLDKPRGDRREPAALAALGVAAFSMVLFYYYLDYRVARDLGGSFGLQGRYYLPAVAAQMAWLMVGLTYPLPQRLRKAGMWLLGVAMMVLNGFVLRYVLIPRYYGRDHLLEQVARITTLQPVSAGFMFALLLALALGCALTVVAWWGALVVHDPVSYVDLQPLKDGRAAQGYRRRGMAGDGESQGAVEAL